MELSAFAGLSLDPWQQLSLDVALGERADGRWSALEVGLVVCRQSGKGTILEARELAGLFLFGEELIIHSAHNFDTAMEGFRRVMELIQSTPEFDDQIAKVSNSHGSEGVELKSGQRLRFRTRTAGGGRGFACNCLILDEAMYLTDAQLGALMPVVSAQTNPQIWYVGSAVDQEVHPNGMAFTRVRNRGLRGGEPRLAVLDWSAPGSIDDHDPSDRRLWAQANPGLGYRLTEENIAAEQRSMSRRTFAVERLGIGDWPVEGVDEKAIDPAAWARARTVLDTPGGEMAGPIAFAVEVAANRSSASISSAFVRADGDRQVELVDRAEGTAWVPDRLVELVGKYDPCAVVIDPGGPAGQLVSKIEAAGLDLTKTTTREFAQACGGFLAAVIEGGVRHPGEPILDEAIAAVKTRPLGDSWAWERRNFAADVTLVPGVSLALHGLTVHGRPRPPEPAPQLADMPVIDSDDLTTVGF